MPGAMRPALAPASYASDLFKTHARHTGNVRAMGSGLVRRSQPASKRACTSQPMKRIWGSGRHMGHHQHGCHGMYEIELFLRKMVAMNLHRCIMGNFSL
jgi:hypothetical protein